MLFNSFEFLWLFPIIFCIYVVVAYRNKLMKKIPGIANYVLIAISYALYIKWKPVYALILLGVTAITYLFALLIEKKEDKSRQRMLMWGGVSLAALPLLVFKYYNFINETIENILGG